MVSGTRIARDLTHVVMSFWHSNQRHVEVRWAFGDRSRGYTIPRIARPGGALRCRVAPSRRWQGPAIARRAYQTRTMYNKRTLYSLGGPNASRRFPG